MDVTHAINNIKNIKEEYHHEYDIFLKIGKNIDMSNTIKMDNVNLKLYLFFLISLDENKCIDTSISITKITLYIINSVILNIYVTSIS